MEEGGDGVKDVSGVFDRDDVNGVRGVCNRNVEVMVKEPLVEIAVISGSGGLQRVSTAPCKWPVSKRCKGRGDARKYLLASGSFENNVTTNSFDLTTSTYNKNNYVNNESTVKNNNSVNNVIAKNTFTHGNLNRGKESSEPVVNSHSESPLDHNLGCFSKYCLICFLQKKPL